ncbi:MAG: ATP-binding protein [Gammaproteobacteria bacterium]|jgi:signal transduction histidine kinase|nr:ATP-binding protein [Gammaproteobacteria bacterium]HIJ28687.1 ATP-binding protein [Gammaproteobacteria bacterium]HIJ32347.1 ATP-binding protein [Gammaproteobacteria bacterium]HIJ47164.1 ATP-binding protein [Gammaproteobacteria bacterium]
MCLLFIVIMLTLAKVDGISNLDSRATAVDLNQVAQENIDILSHRALDKKISLIFEHATDSSVEIMANRELLSTLLRNLIDNAIRYTPERGWIKLNIKPLPQRLRVSLRDSGPGIPQELQQRIFERFYRNSTTASGSGLGLSISKQIAEIHGASIALKNCSSPDGFEVTIDFPIH